MTIVDLVRARGPLTVAAFMELALYDPRFGYYARAAQRSGRAGDFFTSVDVGPLFGELLAVQIAEMADLLHGSAATSPVDLVEAGAGNGRLAADILRAVARRQPRCYERLRVHLAEASASARAAQRATLGTTADRLHASAADLPASFEGVLLANELLDALPVHQVVMRPAGLREVYVAALDEGGATRLVTQEGPVSTPELARYFAALGLTLEPGWRVEVGLRSVEWTRLAARRLRRGFLVLIDYGHDARELYSAAHAGGTLTSFAGHTMAGADAAGAVPPWLQRPGDQDITAHVDFTSVRAAAEAEGLTTLGYLDQTYFLLGLLTATDGALDDGMPLKQRLALRTLLMPGGLGSTMKVLVLGKDVGRPALRGCSYRQRVT